LKNLPSPKKNSQRRNFNPVRKERTARKPFEAKNKPAEKSTTQVKRKPYNKLNSNRNTSYSQRFKSSK
jgi:hypothetical protein